MSQFTPEAFVSSSVTPPPAGQTGSGLNGIVKTQMAALLSDPISNVPAEFKKWLEDYLAINGQDIPVSQISGFTQFTAQVAPTIDPEQSTTSNSYTDLGTVGPTLTGLPDGNYLVAFGAVAYNTTTDGAAAMSVQVNTTAASDNDWALTYFTTPFGHSITRITTVALTLGGNNTLTAKYRRGNATGTAHFSARWLIALRYSNA